jgi:hypothetical protein
LKGLKASRKKQIAPKTSVKIFHLQKGDYMDEKKINFEQYVGKTIKLYFVDGYMIQGKYVGWTPAYDNDPEIASIEIDGICHYSIDLPELDHIDIAE